ncbi:hypothetical protein Ddc_11332 [Ditylenchus destructor]|nr:hypothetical protein Ddc_11332 [Ditylenchus destructor]
MLPRILATARFVQHVIEINSNFCDVEHTEDENLDFYAEEQASEEADDNHKNINEDIHELFKNSIVYENLCYADYTEDDFDDFDE